jgi:hypothetical protein
VSANLNPVLPVQSVGPKSTGKLPGPVQADRPMSDLQAMQADERKRHMDTYIYEHGHNDGSSPLGEPSF